PDYRRETGRGLPPAPVIMDEFQGLFSGGDPLARGGGRLPARIAQRGAAVRGAPLVAPPAPRGPPAAHPPPPDARTGLRAARGCGTRRGVSRASLGEGSDAAPRLVRAGDAIYNDRRGEGANPVMRIAMLPTRDRLALIGDIRALGGGREYPPPASFDPDAAASFVPGDTADAAWTAGTAGTTGPGRPVQAWLGEAIEIKAATTPTVERYPRSHLPLVGGEEYGHGLLLATLLSAAYQRSPAHVRFTIAEFTRPSSPFHGFFDPVRNLPHEVRIADRRTAADELDDLAADLEARLDGSGPVD